MLMSTLSSREGVACLAAAEVCQLVLDEDKKAKGVGDKWKQKQENFWAMQDFQGKTLYFQNDRGSRCGCTHLHGLGCYETKSVGMVRNLPA